MEVKVMPVQHRLMRVSEVAVELGYEPRQILRMIKLGAIPSIRLHKQSIRIPRRWLNETLAKYPDIEAYKQAKENIRFDADNLVKPIITEPIKVFANNQEIAQIPIKEDEMKRKTESTEIVTNKPKARPFIPNPKKRVSKSKPDNSPDSSMDDLNNDSKSNQPQGYTIGGL
jgi:hypothetical protein